MHYVAIVAGQERHIEITEIAPNRYQLMVEGQRLDVDARETGATSLSLLIQSQIFNAELERHPDTYDALLRGHRVSVEVLDLRRMRLRRAQENQQGPEGPASMTAPMPGKVVAILVKEGQSVAAGQGVLVVEAMKMENELRAPKAGTVQKLRTTVGAAVETGTCLCVIE